MNFLKEAEYHFYFAGLCLWETSRSRSPVLLHLPFSQHSLPCFIEATHECFQCARRMQPCFHPCCKEWFLQVGRKCNYFQDNPGVVVTDDFKNTPRMEKESKRTISSLESRLPPAKRKKTSGCTRTSQAGWVEILLGLLLHYSYFFSNLPNTLAPLY